ncbi:hypothetical protein SBOR_5880 [Sclerotinia borealis F-4128]|uniref:Uncharacterized protein n=1 Tax=Sclerotinia borealis (strain F-4128) TaxID=1432307 RepID=W9CD42_SCLBF|nr:hypothetical protein SBOR_5880 [Sclerotinia borealis F-4128]
MASSSTPASYSTDPALYLYTSLTSGSSHIVTATSRLETILKANRIPFKALDIATDEKARMLWGRRAGKDESGRARKIPGLVQMGLVLGDLVEIEDWNEYGELKQHIKIVPVSGPGANPAITAKVPTNTQENNKPAVAPAAPPASTFRSVESKPPSGAAETTITLAMRQATQEAAQKAKDMKKKATEALINATKSEPKKALQPAIVPTVPTPKERHTFEIITILQNSDDSTWSAAPFSESRASRRASIHKLESLQSPTSTAWRPKDVDPPILMHRGSSVSSGSAEEIKQIEDEETIPEEDEDEESDSDK